jgi:hypothetical protein
MAITVDWANKIINVPKADMTLVQSNPTEIRRLDIDAFRLTLKDLEDDEGMPFLDTHRHNTSVDVGGVTLARVVEIINGYTITFEDGQYAVNLVGANSNIADITNVNQVSVRSSNSAGLVDLPLIQLQSYTNAQVFIDTQLGTVGQSYPVGTPTLPALTFTDAISIANTLNLEDFHIRGNISPGNCNLDARAFEGHSVIAASMTFDGTCSTIDTSFRDISVTGTLSGDCHFKDCMVSSLNNFSGQIDDSGIGGDITVNSSNVNSISLINCNSLVTGVARPTLDLNNSTGPVNIRKYTGGMTISNWTGGQSGSVDVITGTIEFDSSCTNGNVKVRITNPGSMIDNSGVGFTVILENNLDTLEHIKPAIKI